jgi:hypothetical protein
MKKTTKDLLTDVIECAGEIAQLEKNVQEGYGKGHLPSATFGSAALRFSYQYIYILYCLFRPSYAS